MVEFKTGLVKFAGHDKNELYIIISVKGNMFICQMAETPFK